MRQIMGDDGIWLEQLDDGNVIPLIEIFPPLTEDGTSIEVELPADDGNDDAPEAQDEPVAEPASDDSDAGDS